MAMASYLPTELWLLIVRYLPKSQILQLKSQNSFFFSCGMDIDWGKVEIDTRNSDRAARVLSRMADPFVARRIRELTIRLRQPKTPSNFPVASSQPQITIQATLVTQLLDVLPLLPNLTYLKIELSWIDLGLLPALFHTIATSPLARTIETLSLNGHPDLFASLVRCPNPETKFANLSALHIIQLDRDHNDFPKVTVDTSSILSLASFILSFSASLKIFRIWSSFDVSLLLSHLSKPVHDSSSLTPFPNLTSTLLILPFNNSFRSAPQSIHRFLRVHSSNIQHLQLRLRATVWPSWDDTEGPLGTWLSDFVNDFGDGSSKNAHFLPNLRTLDIHPPPTSAGLSATLTFIERTLSTLSSLIIRECDLTSEGANQVVHVLAGGGVEASKLKSLRMHIIYPDVSFIRLLALKLPRLQNLHLNLANYSSSRSWQDLFILDVMDNEDGNLTSWKLRYLSIWDHGLELSGVVAAVASVVPSLVLMEDDEDSDTGNIEG